MTTPLRRATRARIQRRHRMVLIAILVLIAMGAVILAVPRRAGGEEPWEAVLRQQLRVEHNCTPAAFVHVRKVPLAGVESVEGRVRCGDGREYDFTQPQPHQKFLLKRCEPALC